MLAAFNLISENLQLQRKLGSVHGCRVLLRLEKASLLQCASLSIVPLCHVEDHSVSVKLWCSIAVYGTRGVMLEGSCNELAGCFWRMDVTNASLCIAPTPAMPLEHYRDALRVRDHRHRQGP